MVGEIYRRRAAIEDLDEVVGELGAGVAATRIDLTDNQICRVVVLNRALALAVCDRRAGDVREIHEERFVWLDQRVAVHRHVKSVGRVTGGDCLRRQTSGNVIVVFGRRIVVLRRAVSSGDVKGDAARRRR